MEEVGTSSFLPDLGVLSTPEIEIPTLNMDSDSISLSGIISQFINLPQSEPVSQIPGQVYQVTPVTEMMQHQALCHSLESGHNSYNHLTMGHGHTTTNTTKPFIRIIEQPKSNSLRFRYQCEGRGAGALQGQHSTAERKTYPKIQILGTTRPAVVVVSCVTVDNDPPRAHPHNLVSPASVGKEGCKKGVCTLHVNNEDMTVEFQHLGIQCVRKKDIEDSLKQRQEIRVDPFKQQFKHMENPSSIDLNAVKLCFQAFLEDPKTGKFTLPVSPVCSTNIFDAKARKELQIMEISDVISPAEGGKKILIFCEKVAREDIKVRFSDSHGWEGWGDFNPSDVHKQYGIAIKTPKYRDGNIKEKTKVFLELFKPSDESVSEPQDFFFVPYEGSSYRLSTIKTGKQYPAYNNGGVGSGYKDIKDINIKQETVEQAWVNNRMAGSYSNSPQYSRSSHNPQQNMHSIQTATPYSLAPAQHQPGYIPNIPNIPSSQTGGYTLPPTVPPVPTPQLINPYSCQQPSPDSQGFANMNLAGVSPQHKPCEEQYNYDPEVENMSGKLEGFTLSDVLDSLNGFQAPEETRRGKRSQQTAALESGSNVVPREMARMGGGGGDTSENTGNYASYLNNCSQINDLN